MTASARCAVFRFTFDPADKVGRIVLDPIAPAALEFTPDGFRASASHHGLPAPGNFAMYYVGRLDRPVTKSYGLEPQKARQRPGEAPGGYLEFDVSTKPVVELTVASSFISFDQAEQYLRAETVAGFDRVRAETAGAWDAQLNRIEVTGTEDEKKTFYSCLFRAMKFPHRLDEITADNKRIHYSPWDGKIHDGPAYTDNGLWDTYRTQFPLLSIAWQDQLGDICAGWLNAYHEAGWLPNWPSPGGIDGMPGTHADVMFSDAMVKHIPGFNYNDAYAAVHKDSFVQGGYGAGRSKLKLLIEKGYLPQGPGVSSVSDTLDYCYDDWAVAQVARLTGHADEAVALEKRSRGYSNLWDPAVGFMRPKDADGKWFGGDFDQFAWGTAYVEGGPWQCSWSVPWDVAGLSKLAGGNDAFAAKLDTLFSLPPTFHPGGYGGTIHEMTEMIGCDLGQCGMNNQPSFHIPYLYAAIGRPWQTEFVTRKACRTLFNSSPQGFPGDEDTGSMASWYILSSMGIYPLTPGVPQYVLTSPVFEKVVIHLANGKTFTINAPGNTDQSVYVQSRRVNGVAWTRTWISHQDLTAGGTMEVTTGTEPVKRVATGVELPYSLSGGDH
jgi:predicted alpha-1,2-mannosidase